MTETIKSIGNSSKELSHADDSAAALLVDLLKGTPGRNFDIESLFVERLDSGNWRWVVYEFLKADTIPPKSSHPNYYWDKNKRKFLSLWTLVCTLRKAGHEADLILVNYADDREKGIKEMQVIDIKVNPVKIFRHASESKDELKNHVETRDVIMSFDDWKKKFRHFNDNKKGDTWELLESVLAESSSAILLPESSSKSDQPICDTCKQPFAPRTKTAKLCIECWKTSRN